MFKANLISESDYDKAVADLHQAEAQVKMKEAALQRSKVDLSRCTIYAPVDGIVIHDVPLLVESTRGIEYGAVIVVEAPKEVRLERL